MKARKPARRVVVNKPTPQRPPGPPLWPEGDPTDHWTDEELLAYLEYHEQQLAAAPAPPREGEQI